MRAVLFDLYGTLLAVERSSFERQLPRRLGIGAREWIQFLRRELLLRPFADRRSFVEAALRAFVPDRVEELVGPTLELVDRDLATARVLPGVRSLLSFLRHRGLRLGLISNLASPYREPVSALGLSDAFDAVAFSCERGVAKPAPELYLDVCRELEVAPGEALMVGDSLGNDVEAPRALGLSARLIGPWRDRHGALSIAGVGLLTLEDEDPQPLLAPGDRIELAGEPVTVSAIDPVADDDQGRYNLVYAVRVEDAAGTPRTIYCKRYLMPESARVEEFVHALLREVGMARYRVGVLELAEPLFWSDEVQGEKLETIPWTPRMAFDGGHHGACAFLFANGDLRPRNTLVQRADDRLVMLDHEHCLFNLALDVTGQRDPFDPHALDALGADELRQRVRRHVLTPRTMRRAHREFFGDSPPAILAAYRDGWIRLHRLAQERRERLRALLEQRLYSQPHLVVGTRAYRRAMARLDIEDLLSRVDSDPERSFAEWLGVVEPEPVASGA